MCSPETAFSSQFLCVDRGESWGWITAYSKYQTSASPPHHTVCSSSGNHMEVVDVVRCRSWSHRRTKGIRRRTQGKGDKTSSSCVSGFLNSCPPGQIPGAGPVLISPSCSQDRFFFPWVVFLMPELLSLVLENDDWIRTESRRNVLGTRWSPRRLTAAVHSTNRRSDWRSQMEPIPKAMFMPFLPLLSAVYTRSKGWFFLKHRTDDLISEELK